MPESKRGESNANLDSWIQAFLSSAEISATKSEHTVRAYGHDIQHWWQHGASTNPPWSLGAYLHRKLHRKSPATKARARAAILKFYDFVEKRGGFLGMPSRLQLGKPRVKSKRVETQVVSRQRWEDFLVWIAKQPGEARLVSWIVDGLYGSGLRVFEWIQLVNSSQIPNRDWVQVVGKGKVPRAVLLTPAAQHALCELRSWSVSGGSLHQRSVYRWLDQAWQEYTIDLSILGMTPLAELEILKSIRLGPHLVRHCFATHLLAKGMNLRSLQTLLGHQQLTTTERYTHLEVEEIRQTLEDIFEMANVPHQEK